MSDGSSVAAGVKRKMRKGTASCIECRRRKIKCTFIHGDARCANCLARGTQCIDQRDTDGADDFVPEDSTTSLRERVATLERQLIDVVHTLRNDLQRNRASDQRAEASEGSDLESTARKSNPQTRFTAAVSNVNGDWNWQRGRKDGYLRVTISERKANELCKILRSNLPGFDTLLESLGNHGTWWPHWRRQVQPSGEPIEDIASYVQRTFASRIPGELGSLIALYARQTWRGKFHLYGYVESLIVADAAYSTTIEGIECLILIAQCYMDMGQPRRAWLLYQRGISLARLMGLDRAADRDDSKAAKKAALWWSIYLGDRLCSMVLGLPTGVNDFTLGLQIGSSILASAPPQRQFMVRCAVVSGRILDRCTQNGATFSVGISHAEDLEAEMNAIAMSVPQEWWSLGDTSVERLPTSPHELDEVRAQLLQQSYYFQVRMHINLSHLGDAPGSPHWQSKLNCMEDARQLLKRSVLLSTRLGDHRMFECKTNDFIGFIAAAILTIGLYSLGNDVDQSLVSHDQFLVDQMRQNFQKEEMMQRCQIARQCGNTLEVLQRPREERDALSDKIVIPYFGTVVKKSQQQQASDRNVAVAMDTTSSQNTDWMPPYPQDGTVPVLGIDGQPTPDLFSDNLYWELEGSQGYFTNDFNPLLDPAMVDLSQDWSLFSSLEDSPIVSSA